jgi:hypothetical protein
VYIPDRLYLSPAEVAIATCVRLHPAAYRPHQAITADVRGSRPDPGGVTLAFLNTFRSCLDSRGARDHILNVFKNLSSEKLRRTL